MLPLEYQQFDFSQTKCLMAKLSQTVEDNPTHKYDMIFISET